MPDRPILFSGPMVRAQIREVEAPGTGKTQTRRMLKPKKHACLLSEGWTDSYILDPGNREWLGSYYRWRVGDRLWVRESFWITEVAGQGIGEPFLVYEEEWTSGPGAKEPKPAELRDGFGMGRWGHRPGIHMPRRASRLTDTVTGVRVERLQDISEADAIAEGASQRDAGWSLDWGQVGTASRWGTDGVITERDIALASARHAFGNLWNRINGADNWEHNPWVVVVTYRPELRNIDARLLLSGPEQEGAS